MNNILNMEIKINARDGWKGEGYKRRNSKDERRNKNEDEIKTKQRKAKDEIKNK